MLRDGQLRGKWVAYHRDERIAVGPRECDVMTEVERRRLPTTEYATFLIEAEFPEVHDTPSSWR